MLRVDETPLLLKEAFKGVRTKHYPKGQIILYQGDPPLDVLLLKSGVIKIYDIDEQGNEKILHLLKPWAILPLAFFSGNDVPTRWFYAALTDCDVCVLPTEKLTPKLAAESELILLLTHWFSTEVHELLVRLSSLGKTTSRDKLLAALMFLATKHATQRRSGWMRVTFPVNHQLLADMSGITRESAAMVMKQFKDEQLVRHPRMTILEINADLLQ
jgi:CRP/FNR family transcriptional regulator